MFVAMTTVSDVVAKQKKENILFSPETQTLEVAAATGTLTIGLVNQSSSNTVYAYVTGLAINNNYAVVLLQADGSTLYYPTNPSYDGSALKEDCAIPLGAPGSTTTVIIPYIAGGRIWFSVGSTLTFLLNSGIAGPGLVEPSVSNTSDPNYLKNWDFCEFTYNSDEVFANITYVDFVCLPISLTLNSTSGAVKHVRGLPSNGLATVCDGLIAQSAIDGAGWDQLIIRNGAIYLRALNPTQGIVFNSALFKNYWTSYVDAVWSKYASTPLIVNTQASWGDVLGLTSNLTSLSFSSIGSFTKPSAADIFGGASGAFAAQPNNTDQLLNIGARLDAALNRSTLLIDSFQPNNEVVSTYYKNAITNHYARIVHAANVDGLGYCFPYDDVTPDGGVNQCGAINDSSPSSLIVTVGGNNAYAQSKVSTVENDDSANENSLGTSRGDHSAPGEEQNVPSHLDAT
ncbi:93b36166-6870-4642-8744-10fa85390baf-CDS [Sclerotinia trifoliorum]|uniref:93b36166-6870-4642-8744-10fa85390baf-CDS n=1 Tax=Sclerotinia trifoliorum TaxID=28548 RepID=A0A8H2VX15_9HELO|nr:93b36166-6870-4642-8744-10fa85390baf-CDS [Sclerotinia trifoliorum]